MRPTVWEEVRSLKHVSQKFAGAPVMASSLRLTPEAGHGAQLIIFRVVTVLWVTT